MKQQDQQSTFGDELLKQNLVMFLTDNIRSQKVFNC